MGVHTNQARRGRTPAILLAILGMLAVLLVPASAAGAADPGAGAAPAAAPKGPKVSQEATDAVAGGADAFVVANLAAPANAPQAIESTAQSVIDGLPEGSYQGEARAQAVPFVALKVDSVGLDALEADPSVTSVVLNHRNVQSLVNSVPAVGGDSARNQGYDGAGTAVAVLDVGVQADHPFLSDGLGNSRVVAEGCFSGLGNLYPEVYSLCPSGNPTQTGPGSAAPCPIAAASACGHGTHVAGIAAGGLATNNGSSQPKWGVAPKASILAANVFSLFCAAGPNPDLSCPAPGWQLSAFDSDIALAMNWVDGLRSSYDVAAVNLSVGSVTTYPGTCDGGTVLTTNINTLKSHGVASVVASGNSSSKSGISSPACVSSAVSVGSWDDGTNTVSTFSNSSSQLTLLAPGARNNGGILSSYPTSTYASVKGTSMAAPHVAGAMALLHQLKPANTVDQNVAMLTSTGTGVTDSANGITKPLIRIAAAMASVATVPGAPQSVTAGGGDGQIAVSWQAARSGGSPITSYTATLSPGGATCTWTTGPLGCTIGSLTNGTTYTVTVHAHNAIGDGPESASASTAPSVPYVPIVPTRYFESRTPAEGGGGTFDGQYAGAGKLRAGVPIAVPIAGRGTVPANAVAVALNVTVTGSTGGGYLTVWDDVNADPPLASNLNFGPGQVVANMVMTKVGADGSIAMVSVGGNTPVIVDVVGYYLPGSSYTPIVPTRYLETRTPAQGGGGTWDGVSNAQGPIPSGGTRDVVIAGRTSNSETPVPADATAVALNVTVATSTGGGYMTVYPTGVTAPLASNLNFYPGQSVPNMVISKVGAGGSITIRNVGGVTDVIVDVVGYFAPGQGYTPLVPARLMESRTSAQGGAPTVDGFDWGVGPILPGGTYSLQISGRGGVPAFGVRAVALNVTVAGAINGGGYVTVYPSGVSMPLASNLNYYQGQVIPNMVVAKLGPDGKVSISNFGGTVPLVVDVVGWFP